MPQNLTTYSLKVKHLSVVGTETGQNGIFPVMARMGRPPRSVADKRMMSRMGELLKWVRQANGWSQEQAAAVVGVHQTSWSLYERGLRWPDQFEVQRLTAKLKIDLNYLLTGSLEGVERDLAIRLAAAHPELVSPRSTEPRKDMGQS